MQLDIKTKCAHAHVRIMTVTDQVKRQYDHRGRQMCHVSKVVARRVNISMKSVDFELKKKNGVSFGLK